MNTTIIIMAAGIGSRFGTGIKQLAKMAPNGEIIMDFSIYDAKAAGFTKVVFVIRKAIEAEFKEVIGNRLSKVMPVEYVYQELENLPDGYEVPAGRVKPWGTGQAILACKSVVKEPFVIINADASTGAVRLTSNASIMAASRVLYPKRIASISSSSSFGEQISWIRPPFLAKSNNP